MTTIPSHNVGLDLVRVTEATALVAGRWLGLGNREGAHRTATAAMANVLNTIAIDGRIVIGEEGRLKDSTPLDSGQRVGTGHGPEVDVVVDPVDGTALLVAGRLRAISVVAIAPKDTIWSPKPAVYMEKIVVDREVGNALIPECMDAPVAWTLALIARAKQKAVRDLQVIILDRLRNQELIEEIRMAGARVLLRDHGDTAGALLAATPSAGPDLLMGIGGVSEGVTAACAVKAMRGAMLVRLKPQSAAEEEAVAAAGLDTSKILTCSEMITSDKTFFAATGITPGSLLDGVEYHGSRATTHSLVLRGQTGTRRTIYTEYNSLGEVMGAK
jgi:fructose-1,6-bisphosphatase II